MPPAPRFRLVRLEAAHWRGIGDAVAIPLDQPLNIIYGPNGAGKSSLLTAIEWALFPREAQRITDHHIAERRGWETRHVHSREQPSVELELVSGGRKSSVLRAGRTPSTTPAVQASYADFKGLAFLHQETLRDFLVGTPAARQSAFQRLLGAGWAQDAAKAFESASRALDVDTVDRTVDAMERQLHTRLLEARRQLGALEFDAAAVGLAPPWEETVKRLTEEVETLKQSTTPAPSTSAAERRQKIESRRAAWLVARDHHQHARQAADAAGTVDETEARLKELTAEQQQLRAALQSLNRLAALLRDALAQVKLQPASEVCPVCTQPASATELADALESRLGLTVSAEESSLRVQLDRVQSAISAADARRAEIARLHANAARATAELERSTRELTTLLGRELAAAEDPAAIAAREVARLEAEMARDEQALRAAQARLAELERAGSRLSLARRVAEQLRRVSKLEGLREQPEWHRMLEAQRKLAVRELMLQHAGAAVRAKATALASANLERARKPIGYIYTQLTRRQDFPAVVVDPEDKFEVSLATANDAQVSATAVLNLTDLNCLAIAVMAGMAVAFPEAHDLEFLILDDPAQGMDPQVSARLAPILGHLAKRLQVIVATPDAALVEALRKQPVYKNIITLEPRDGKSTAPQLRVRGVER